MSKNEQTLTQYINFEKYSLFSFHYFCLFCAPMSLRNQNMRHNTVVDLSKGQNYEFDQFTNKVNYELLNEVK